MKKGREEKVWFAIRVTYNRELKVKEDLDAHGIQNFVPMQYRREERHGVMVKRLVPSVHNLIFIHITPTDMKEYKMSTELPIRYIMDKANRKPIIVPEKEILLIIAEKEKSAAILDTIRALDCFSTPGSGICFCSDVDNFTILGKK